MATYYVESGHGGTNSGTVDNPWTTIDTAMNNVAAGDTVYVKASATYDENANIDTAGAITTPITFIGYGTTTTDNIKVTWKNSSGVALTDTPTSCYYTFKNFSFDGSSSIGAQLAGYFSFVNCDFKNNGGNGVVLTDYGTFVNCTFSGNTGNGAQAGVYASYIGCIFNGNSSRGVFANNENDNRFYRCVFYNNNSTSDIVACGDFSEFFACTFDGDGSNQAAINSGIESVLHVVDCIMYDITNGVESTDVGSTIGSLGFRGYNLVNGVTTAYTSGFPGVENGYKDITSAPAFTNEAGDDYTLGSSSPAIDAGIQPGGIT